MSNYLKTYDSIVIGGGVIGCSVAYHLAKKGQKIALIERGDIASGTSSHCDAVILICDKEPGIDTKMGFASLQRFKELAEELSYDFEFIERGCLYVCEAEEEMIAAKRYVEAQQADGYDMRMMDSYEIKQKEPLLADDLLGGFWSSADAGVNPYKLCFAYVHELKMMGQDVLAHHEVLDIEQTDGRVTGVVTDHGTYGCDNVVNSAGVWAPALGKMVGIDIPIKPRKGIVMISERGNPVCHQKVQEFGYMMSKFDDIKFERPVSKRVAENNVAMVIEPTSADNFMLGSNRIISDEFSVRSEIDAMQAQAERCIRYFPCVKDINCIRTYAGMRPFVPDHLPIMSDVEGIPGYWICAGHEGDGISMSAFSGLVMSQMMTGEETAFDMSQMRFSRFQNK